MTAILKILLWPFSLIYRFAIGAWDLYWNNSRTVKLPCRVISVGNIEAGGAGKTPLVISIAGMAAATGRKTAVVARGYKREKSGLTEVSDHSTWREVGDEPLEVYKRVPGIRVYVDKSKTIAAGKACENGAEIIIVDDGFQHRRLYRDIDIVCLDWAEPFGSGGLLPSGTLREPAKNLTRADILVFTSYEPGRATGVEVGAGYDCFYARSEIRGLMNLRSGEVMKAQALRDSRLLAFCGLARPEKFRGSLRKLNLNVVDAIVFPDHFGYSQDDIDKLIAIARAGNADCLITTFKDAVKIGGFDFGGFEVYSAMQDIAIIDNSGNDMTAEFKARLEL